MKKINSIAALVEAFGKKTNVKAWEKNGKSRLYFNGLGHNTKKMETKAWIEIGEGSAVAVVRIDCPSQPISWIQSQQEEVKQQMEKYVRYINLFYDFGTTGTPIEVVINNAILDAEEVQGYYTEWREVVVKINRFGKQALRRRQFVVPFKGTKNTAPRAFVALGDKGFAMLLKRGEDILEPYAEVPNYDGIAMAAEKFMEEHTEKLRALAIEQQEKKAKEAEESRNALSRIATLQGQGVEILKAWKIAGCPHPAPAQVMEAKASSGLNWKQFANSIL